MNRLYQEKLKVQKLLQSVSVIEWKLMKNWSKLVPGEVDRF